MRYKILSRVTPRDVILGGQDGLVNILGLSLGLFAAGGTVRVIVVAGLAAAFSEAVSMGAVAYTSASAEKVKDREKNLLFNAIVVGLSALIFALLPLLPFFLSDMRYAIVGSVILSAIILFAFGAFKARSNGDVVWKSGIQILIIGIVSALAGFGIGFLLKV